MKIKFKIGQNVEIHCISGLGTGGIGTITDIITKYDPDTGKPFKVICFKDHHFIGIGGNAITPPYGYYIITEKGE